MGREIKEDICKDQAIKTEDLTRKEQGTKNGIDSGRLKEVGDVEHSFWGFMQSMSVLFRENQCGCMCKKGFLEASMYKWLLLKLERQH